jgi:serine O-acetyltransferase
MHEGKSSGFWKLVTADARAYGVKRRTPFFFLAAALGLNKFSAVFLFRVATALYGRHRVATSLAKVVTRINSVLNSCEFSAQATIGPGLHIPHPIGIVCGIITAGKNLTIFQNVTIGLRDLAHELVPTNYAEFGDNVTIGPAAVFLGPVRIGENAFIGANAVVMEDIPSGARAVGNPARIVQEEIIGDKMGILCEITDRRNV